MNDPVLVLNEKRFNFANYLEELNSKLQSKDIEQKISLIRSVDIGAFLVAMNVNVTPLLDKDPKDVCQEYGLDASALTAPEIDKIVRYCKLFTGKT